VFLIAPPDPTRRRFIRSVRNIQMLAAARFTDYIGREAEPLNRAIPLACVRMRAPPTTAANGFNSQAIWEHHHRTLRQRETLHGAPTAAASIGVGRQWRHCETTPERHIQQAHPRFPGLSVP
jgi:hypothetical protein